MPQAEPLLVQTESGEAGEKVWALFRPPFAFLVNVGGGLISVQVNDRRDPILLYDP